MDHLRACDKSPMCGGARLLFSSSCLADCRSMQSHWRPPDFTHKEIWLPVYLSEKQDPQHTTKTPFLLLSEGLHSISQSFVLHFSSHIWSEGPKCYNSPQTVWQGGEKEAEREIRHLPLKWRVRWGVKIFLSRILCFSSNHGYMERSEQRGCCFDCREEHTLFHI